MTRFKLGIDTGGTYTDAVLLDAQKNIVATAKSLTTRHDLALGIGRALAQVLSSLEQGRASHSASPTIELVGLSTTLATNAVVEGEGQSVAVILVGYTEKQLEKAALASAIGNNPVLLLDGGHKASGAEAQPLDLERAEAFIKQHHDQVEAFAVSAMFAVRNPDHELQLQALIQELSGQPVTLGHHLSGALDAPRRALTATLNAKLIPLTDRLMSDVERALKQANILAPLMVVKGDGSLISAALARSIPVETILSGPAASVVGTQYLTDQTDLLVSDMGGTTTDVCLIQDGKPQLSDSGASVGGWRTMVEAVQVFSYGLGGDSDVHYSRESRDFALGPRRVIPLSLLASDHPSIVGVLEQQLERGWGKTYDGRFILRRNQQQGSEGMSPRQKAIWQALDNGPVALTQLYEQRVASSTLDRMLSRGWISLSGFTPSDAAHVLNKQHSWHRPAAVLGATLHAKYSEGNLGPAFKDAEDFASFIMQKVSTLSSVCLLNTLLQSAEQPIKHSENSIDLLLSRKTVPLVQVTTQLSVPIAAVGAPAASYYPATAEQLNTHTLDLQHAEVANAIGAVVGQVRQRVLGSIQPIGAHEFNVHTPNGIERFTDLEKAAAHALEQLRHIAIARAQTAGCQQPETRHTRHDVVVTEEGQELFFESKLSVTAFGLPQAHSPMTTP